MIRPKSSAVFPPELENADRNECRMGKYLRDFGSRQCPTERDREMFEDTIDISMLSGCLQHIVPSDDLPEPTDNDLCGSSNNRYYCEEFIPASRGITTFTPTLRYAANNILQALRLDGRGQKNH